MGCRGGAAFAPTRSSFGNSERKIVMARAPHLKTGASPTD